MRKIVFLLFVLVVTLCFIARKNSVLIPDSAIRLRIIANSNSINDQEYKAKIKNEITKILYSKLNNVDNYEDAKKILNDNISTIKKVINNYVNDFEINYGYNNFPEKEYKGVKYDEGDYESLVIKLGEGKGENFWCVLFPPLCMIDENELDDASYSLFVTKLLNKIK